MFRPRAQDLRSAATGFVNKGKYEKALECYLALEKKEPREPEWSRRIGQIYERLGENERALAALQRSMEKYRKAGFEAKAGAVENLIRRLDPTAAPEMPRTRRRLAVGTDRIPPTTPTVPTEWAYHPEASKQVRLAQALADLVPEPSEEPSDSTESAGRRRR